MIEVIIRGLEADQRVLVAHEYQEYMQWHLLLCWQAVISHLYEDKYGVEYMDIGMNSDHGNIQIQLVVSRGLTYMGSCGEQLVIYPEDVLFTPFGTLGLKTIQTPMTTKTSKLWRKLS